MDIVIKMAYDDFSDASIETGLLCLDESKAVQSAKEDADINTIVKRFGLTGQLPKDIQMPEYADFDQVHDFHSALNIIAESREAFMAFPADIRARFDNDPQRVLEFLSNGENRAEAEKLGFVVPKPVAADPAAAPVAPSTVVT